MHTENGSYKAAMQLANRQLSFQVNSNELRIKNIQPGPLILMVVLLFFYRHSACFSLNRFSSFPNAIVALTVHWLLYLYRSNNSNNIWVCPMFSMLIIIL